MRRWILLLLLFAMAPACGAGTSDPPRTPAVAIGAGVAAHAEPVEPAARTCSRGVVALLGSLRGPIRVELYFTRGIPGGDAFVQALDALLARYAAQSGGRLDVKRHRGGRRSDTKAR